MDTVSVKEAARRLGVSPTLIYTLVRQNNREIVPGLRAVIVGTRVRVPLAPLETVLAGGDLPKDAA